VADRDSSQAAIKDYEVTDGSEIHMHRAGGIERGKTVGKGQDQLDSAKTGARSLRAKIALAKQTSAEATRDSGPQRQSTIARFVQPFAGIIVSK